MSSLMPTATLGRVALGSGIATVTSLSSLCVTMYFKVAHGCRAENCKLCDRYEPVLNLSALTLPTAATIFITTVALKVSSLPLIRRCSFIPRTSDFYSFSLVTSLGSFVAGGALAVYIGNHPTSCIKYPCSRCFLGNKVVYPLLTFSAITFFTPLFLSAASGLYKMTLNLSGNWAKVCRVAIAVAAVSGVIGLYVDFALDKPLAGVSGLSYVVFSSSLTLAATVSILHKVTQSI